MSTPIRIAVPPGIGDSHWAMTKVRALKEMHGGAPIHAHVGTDLFHRSAHYLEMVPFVDLAVTDGKINNMEGLLKPNPRDQKWSSLAACRNWMGYDYLFWPNGHLERGERIESWLPELATDHTYDLNISAEVRNMVDAKIGRDRVLLFMGGVEPNHGFHGGWWKPRWWVDLIVLLNEIGIEPVIIGGDNGSDTRYLAGVMKQATDSELDSMRYQDVIGRTTHAEVCALIRMSALWIGLNSGTGIVAAMQGTPTIMLWSDDRFPIKGARTRLHHNMRTSWLTDWQLLKYRTLSYGDPATTPAAIVDVLREVLD